MKVVTELGLSVEDLACTLSDHEKAIRKGLRSLQCLQVGCGQHGLQLAVKHCTPALRQRRPARKQVDERFSSNSNSSDSDSDSSPAQQRGWLRGLGMCR